MADAAPKHERIRRGQIRHDCRIIVAGEILQCNEFLTAQLTNNDGRANIAAREWRRRPEPPRRTSRQRRVRYTRPPFLSGRPSLR